MSDIKLFRLAMDQATELTSKSVQIERTLQNLFEGNLERLLGIRFIASEHYTGPLHSGRIDTLGIDEDDSPVVIEYKRTVSENVINQGLFYIDWLVNHRRDFEWLVLEKLGAEIAKKVDWTAPRLICIAADFTRYDEHAVRQIQKNIELLRYRRFDDDFLMIELVHASKASRASAARVFTAAIVEPSEHQMPTSEDILNSNQVADPYLSQRIITRIANAPADIRALYEQVSNFLAGLGEDVQVKELKYYVAFKRIKNFACLEVFPQARVVTAYLKVDPHTVTLEPGFARDVRKIGHFGTGDLEVSIRNWNDFVKAQPLLLRAYEQG